MAETAEESKGQKAENPTAEWLGDEEARNFAVEGNDLSGYIGVSPEYMTYADDTHKPYSTDEEVLPPGEQLMFEEDEEVEESSEAAKKEDPKKTTAPSATTTPKTASTKTTSSK